MKKRILLLMFPLNLLMLSGCMTSDVKLDKNKSTVKTKSLEIEYANEPKNDANMNIGKIEFLVK